MNNEEFRERYEDWVYINLGRRRDGYHTIFYILTNVTLWRKADGKLKPAYQSFGYLKSSQFTQIKEKVKLINDRCPICKKPRKRVIRGVQVSTELAEIRDSIAFFNKPENQSMLIDKFSPKEIRDLMNHNENQIFLLNVSEREMILGKEIKYKRVVREFKILDVDGLREITTKNKMQYRKDKKKWERDEKEGNGYG